MTNPEAPSTAPVAWCQSEDFRNALFKRQSFSGWREQHTDCDMPLYAHPQASAIAQAPAQAEGPSLDDVVKLCQEFGFVPGNNGALLAFRDMITAATTRWPAPVVQLAAQPVNLDELHDPDFSGGLTPSQHLDVLHGGPDPRVASTAAAPEEAGSESIEAICERVRRKYDRSGLPVPKTFTMVEERHDGPVTSAASTQPVDADRRQP
jgi:hypothetical protein